MRTNYATLQKFYILILLYNPKPQENYQMPWQVTALLVDQY